jgi:hypothetical protein
MTRPRNDFDAETAYDFNIGGDGLDSPGDNAIYPPQLPKLSALELSGQEIVSIHLQFIGAAKVNEMKLRQTVTDWKDCRAASEQTSNPRIGARIKMQLG